MDAQKCIEILSARRNTSVTADAVVNNHTYVHATLYSEDLEIISNRSTTSFELMKLFCSYQSQRIMTYRYFDEELNDIIEENVPARYPLICAEVTQKFSLLSQGINMIKEIMSDREQKDIVDSIEKIQRLEKDKLTCVAAQHLDKLHDTVSDINKITGGKTANQVQYLADKVKLIKEEICECMENIQCIMCELITEQGPN